MFVSDDEDQNDTDNGVGEDQNQDERPEGKTDADDTKGEDEKTFSQADLDRLLQKRLKRQEDQLAKKYADYDTIKEAAEKYNKLEDEKSTDAQRWEKERNDFLAKLAEKDEKLTKLERSTLVADLAADKGLPKNFWKRVSGDTAEDIEEDIDSIIADLGVTKGNDKEEDTSKGTPRKGKLYGGGGANDKPDPDTDSIVAKIPRGPQFRIDNSRK